MVGLVWHQSSQAARAGTDATRALADAQAANQAKMVELFTQTRSTNEEMLKQLRAMAKLAQSPQTPEWIPVSFKLTVERPDGPPAVGYEAILVSGSAILIDQGIHRESDSTGMVDFGVVQPGNWQFFVSKTAEDQRTWKCQGYLNVLPGTGLVKTIVCPAPRPIVSGVKLRVEWPADLAKEDLRLQMTLAHAPTTFEPSLKWLATDSSGARTTRTLLCGPGTTQTEIGGATTLALWRIYEDKYEKVARVFGDLRSLRGQSQADSVALETGSFIPQSLVVLRPLARQEQPRNGERFEVLAHASANDDAGLGVESFRLADPDQGRASLGPSWPLSEFQRGVTLAPSYWRQLEGRFSVRSGQTNEWTFSLPEELQNAVREQLKSQKGPVPKEPRASAAPRASIVE